MTLQVTIVWFMRKKAGTPETGIMINEDKLIIDKEGKPVTKIWNYQLMPYKGNIIFDL